MKLLLLSNAQVKSVRQIIYRPLVYRVTQCMTTGHTHTACRPFIYSRRCSALFKKDDKQLMLRDTITHPIRESRALMVMVVASMARDH